MEQKNENSIAFLTKELKDHPYYAVALVVVVILIFSLFSGEGFKFGEKRVWVGKELEKKVFTEEEKINILDTLTYKEELSKEDRRDLLGEVSKKEEGLTEVEKMDILNSLTQ